MADYPDQGSLTSPEDHPAHNLPTATEHYAGSTLSDAKDDLAVALTGKSFPNTYGGPQDSKGAISGMLNRSVRAYNSIK